jgi:polysaccharide pyruvyl transferase WcaK-like protein
LEFNKLHTQIEQDYIAINLREFPLEYSKNSNSKNINEELKLFIQDVAENFPEREIRLIPMHYFHIGGDDRAFLNSIALELKRENIKVQNPNLTLKETMQTYSNAYFNIGMRFHSVVLQTISSGKNYILDYTEPKKGKIFGFLSDIDPNDFYVEKYISLQKDKITAEIIKDTDKSFLLNKTKIMARLGIYTNKLKEIIK